MKIALGFIFCLLLGLTVFGQNRMMAESFTGTSLQGQEINLENLRGKVVVLTFWSTRCAICHDEIPKLNKISEKYAGKDVMFMALTMENETKIELYLKKNPIKFTVMPNSLGVVLKYADRDSNGNPNMGYPAYFIINQAGEITYKSSGWDKTNKIDSEVNRLLNSKSSKSE